MSVRTKGIVSRVDDTLDQGTVLISVEDGTVVIGLPPNVDYTTLPVDWNEIGEFLANEWIWSLPADDPSSPYHPDEVQKTNDRLKSTQERLREAEARLRALETDDEENS
jgi:hypothetical protein